MSRSFLLALLFISVNSLAQSPHLTGVISVSIKKGTINCNFKLSNIPSLTNYTIWLNSGFNIARIEDSTGKQKYKFKKIYNEKSEEAFQYILTQENNTDKKLPSSLSFSYTGAFPVISDTAKMYALGDDKGIIAFNGSTVRMTEQSAWYPILFDVKNDVTINNYTYSIKVITEDGKAIYLNGDKPKAGIANTFTSTSPVPMLLYAGDLTFQKLLGTYYINTGLSMKERELLARWTNTITTFYANKLSLPCGSTVSYISATPISKDNAWFFVTYPTIAMIGRAYNMHSLFTNTAVLTIDTAMFSFIAHELGHYYFGSLFHPNSDLRWVFLEGFTEYLSLQFIKEKFGQETYKKKILQYVNAVENAKDLVSLSKMKTSSEATEIYKYRYAPLLLTALEKQIGVEQMWKWLATVASSKNVTTNYGFFKSSLISSGVSNNTYDTFEAMYINNDNRIEALVNEFKK